MQVQHHTTSSSSSFFSKSCPQRLKATLIFTLVLPLYIDPLLGCRLVFFPGAFTCDGDNGSFPGTSVIIGFVRHWQRQQLVVCSRIVISSVRLKFFVLGLQQTRGCNDSLLPSRSITKLFCQPQTCNAYCSTFGWFCGSCEHGFVFSAKERLFRF